MAKIGRNEPCPCGSGKKYKKCCLEKEKAKQSLSSFQKRKSFIRLLREEVQGLSTEEIIERLKKNGIDFHKEQFLEDVKRFYSIFALSQQWADTSSINKDDIEEDFLWCAARVLRERLMPDIIDSEKIDDLMQEGYELIYDQEKCVEGCNLWLLAWEYLKKLYITSDTESVEDVDKIFIGSEKLYNWCQDMEVELGNAGLKDPSFYEKKIKYCQEFCKLLPRTDADIINNMMCAEAEVYFALKDMEQGERIFKKAIEAFPTFGWNYIRWADQYWLFRGSDEIPFDYDKAEQIYKMGMEKDARSKKEILERLKELEKRRSYGK
ncbi:MAG: SEC-C domain-containing protein [Nitrospirae bacterium]|nr:SEC-C domain-containing protein [Nitrospirota bacterium]